MDILRWGYYSRMQINETESIPVKWVKCQIGAESPPFDHAFGSSRQLWIPELPGPPVGEIYRHRVRGSDFAESSLPGTHVCGDQGFWQNGWAAGTPPLPVDGDGVPLCCEGEGMGVESVGLSLPNEFIVTGSPVFSSGILSGVWRNQAPNRLLASPANGAIGPLSVRGVVPADLGSGLAGVNTFLRGDLSWQQFDPTVNSSNVVKLFIGSVTSLSGLPMISGYQTVAGDVAIAQVTGHDETLAPYVLAAGAWSLVDWFPAGATYTGPVYVWCVFFDGNPQPAGPSLFALVPLWDDMTTFPVSWTAGVMPLVWQVVAPYNVVNVLGPLAEATVVDRQGVTQTISLILPLAASDVASGYPYSDLSGAPTLPSVAAGTNVSVVDSSGVYTVSVATFPYADLTGVPTAPSVAAGTNVSVSAAGSVYTVSVTGYPASALGSGTLAAGVSVPAAQVGSGYPYSDLSGAPSAGGMQSSGPLITTITTTPQTIFSLTGSNGMLGSIVIKNTGSFAITLSGTYVDAFGAMFTMSGLAGIAAGSNLTLNWTGAGAITFGGTGFGLPKQITLQAHVGLSTTTISAVAQWIQ